MPSSPIITSHGGHLLPTMLHMGSHNGFTAHYSAHRIPWDVHTCTDHHGKHGILRDVHKSCNSTLPSTYPPSHRIDLHLVHLFIKDVQVKHEGVLVHVTSIF